MANEGDDAVRFTHAVLAQCSKLKHVTFFAVLDRATKDNSLELLRDYEKSEPRLRVVWAPENQRRGRCVCPRLSGSSGGRLPLDS
jgi:dolichol-phosphate mannosyltransferase